MLQAAAEVGDAVGGALGHDPSVAAVPSGSPDLDAQGDPGKKKEAGALPSKGTRLATFPLRCLFDINDAISCG